MASFEVCEEKSSAGRVGEIGEHPCRKILHLEIAVANIVCPVVEAFCKFLLRIVHGLTCGRSVAAGLEVHKFLKVAERIICKEEDDLVKSVIQLGTFSKPRDRKSTRLNSSHMSI